MGTYRYWQGGELKITKEAREKWEADNPDWMDGADGLLGKLDAEGWNAELQDDGSILIADGDADGEIPSAEFLEENPAVFTLGSYVDYGCEGDHFRRALIVNAEGQLEFYLSDADTQHWCEPKALSDAEIHEELKTLAERTRLLNAELAARGRV